MKRRAFITLIGGAAAWPFGGARAAAGDAGDRFSQRLVASGRAHLVTAFRQGSGEAGYTEGRNVAIEYRWAEDQYDRLPDWQLIWYAVR